ncbi:MAG TPA: phosphate ABC transporter substrate-binding protein PstS, partial [Gemmataceae bacterium]
MRLWLTLFLSLPLVALLALLAGRSCAGPDRARLNGGGSTFVEPIMKRWSSAFRGLTGVTVDYQGTGSGNGIQQMTEKTIDFGCTDAPMTAEQTAKAEAIGGPVVHVPLVIGSVAVVYNLPGVSELKLTGPVLADIYLGNITVWNDAAIAELNPGVALPDLAIAPVYRAESSGTTNVFKEYLGKVSEEFRRRFPASTAPTWTPGVGSGEKGNGGVANRVKDNAGTVGYVELTYATQNQIPVALLRNRAGRFVAPTPGAVTAAAEAAMGEEPKAEPYT